MKKDLQTSNSEQNNMLTFGGHLEVLRRMFIRILLVIAVFATVIFSFKGTTWELLLAPSKWDFCTYRWIEEFMHRIGMTNFHFEPYHVKLIATELSSQFMTHLSTSIYIGALLASPYILVELFSFIAPALYDNERHYAVRTTVIVYIQFILGVLMSYFILFPIAFRFLGTYSVATQISSTITLDSYISTFTTLTFVMGLVFQLPVIAFALAKMDIVSSAMLISYRKHALIVIMMVAAIITPPDIMTLVLVTVPLYFLYEVSIKVIKWTENSKN